MFRSILIIAGNVFRENLRERFFLISLILGIFFLWLAQTLANFHMGGEIDHFYMDLAVGINSTLGAILILVVGLQSYYRTLESRTLWLLLVRIPSRSFFILGLFLGIWGLLLLFGMVIFVSLWILFVHSGFPFLWDVTVGLAISVSLKLALLWSLALWIASYSRSFLFSFLSALILFCLGHLKAILPAFTNKSHPRDWWVSLTDWVLPNFLVFPMDADAVLVTEWLPLIVYGVVYTSFFLFLSILCFSQRSL